MGRLDYLMQSIPVHRLAESLSMPVLAQARPAGLESTAIVVMIGYLILLLVLGYVGYRKSEVTEEDYYLAGRNQGWIVSSLTIMATFFSSFALLGAPGPPERCGRHAILGPGLETADAAVSPIPVQHGQTHVATVPDQVNESDRWPQAMQKGKVLYVSRGLVSHELFAAALPVQIEHTGDEVRV